MNSRDHIRQTIRKKRKELSPTFQTEAAQKLFHIFISHPSFTESQHIAGYYPVQGELSPLPLLEYAWTLKKKCYLPVLDPKTRRLSFIRYTPDTRFNPNASGIPEPSITEEKIAPHNLDLVIVPLVAFDVAHHRLGFGKGYYDTTFQFLLQKPREKPMLIGVGYTFQKVDNIKPHAEDVPLDEVIVV